MKYELINLVILVCNLTVFLNQFTSMSKSNSPPMSHDVGDQVKLPGRQVAVHPSILHVVPAADTGHAVSGDGLDEHGVPAGGVGPKFDGGILLAGGS